jgi:transposase
LTAPEIRRLLLTLAEPPERLGFRLAWSRFRRRHQARAKHCHAARRARGQPPPGTPTIQVLPAGDFSLSDAQWARIAPVLPPQKPATGRPANDHRSILAGLFWVIRTGASWREVPEDFGPWQTINSRYQRWRQAGIWQQILDVLTQDDGREAAS